MSHKQFRKKSHGLFAFYCDKKADAFRWDDARFRGLPPGNAEQESIGVLPIIGHGSTKVHDLTMFRVRRDKRALPGARKVEIEEELKRDQGNIEDLGEGAREEMYEEKKAREQKETTISTSSFEVLVVGDRWLIASGSDTDIANAHVVAKAFGCNLVPFTPWARRRFAPPSKYVGQKTLSRLSFGSTTLKALVKDGVLSFEIEGGSLTTCASGANHDMRKKSVSGDIKNETEAALGETIAKARMRMKEASFAINSVTFGMSGFNLPTTIVDDDPGRYMAIFEMMMDLEKIFDEAFVRLHKQGAFDSFLNPADLYGKRKDKFLAVYKVYGEEPAGNEEGLQEALKGAGMSYARYVRMSKDYAVVEAQDRQGELGFDE